MADADIRNLTRAIHGHDQTMKKITRLMEAININLTEMARMMRKEQESHEGE